MNTAPTCVPCTPAAPAREPLALWGGVECTHNRVGERYFSQLQWSGHLGRVEDLERFARLGIRTLRYPVLWEMVEPGRGVADWTFADERLPVLGGLGIRPIAGLVHHGSGPRHASIETPRFAPALAEYARRVALRFPWLDAYTPINEPLTTARFCGLYGVWYPHAENHLSFVRILANECRATILSMQAIREVNPAAILVQPDDLGRIYSTPAMQEEAVYQNHRRWLAWDLLHGRVDRHHALWRYLLQHGLGEGELDWFQENACPPDVIGINHYPTSDRFLDEEIHHYPKVVPASNETRLYADVEAVRVRPDPAGGFFERLMEAWARYGTPLAITESHLGCTREEQLRWFAESWAAAERARELGAEVLGVTAWSLLGSYNWNTLVTRDAGYYEPGVFDVRGPAPRPTAIASLLQDFAEGRETSHPTLETPGWWRRSDRLWENSRPALAVPHDLEREILPRKGRILILGAASALGHAFVRECELRGLPYHAISKRELEPADMGAVQRLLHHLQPWAVIDACSNHIGRFSESPAPDGLPASSRHVALAAGCGRAGASLICFSSSMVFDGSQSVYLESHRTAPQHARGRRSHAMEQGVLSTFPGALVIRTGMLFSPTGAGHVLHRLLRALQRGHTVRLPAPGRFCASYIPDVARAALDLALDRAAGIWHLANDGPTTWMDFVSQASEACHIRRGRLSAARLEMAEADFKKPRHHVLGTERGQLLPDLADAIHRFGQAGAWQVSLTPASS